ncbi:MAG: GNAT family N-acetyltransferase, partial [Candidatus Omnitrophica bacterium]|nr:GNAT family N-acetyltransferase [Candidatus Omnitrophota bacterium]
IHSLGKSTRKSIRRKLRDSRSIVELTTEAVEDITGLENKIFELYLNNLNDSEVSFEFLTREFFNNICDNMKGLVKFFITRDKNTIVAFNLVLIKNRTMIDKFVGFDKKISHKYHLYHTTLCHNIDYCIRNGLKYYQMGVTDYEPKIRLGCQIMPLYVSVKFLNPALNLFTGALVKLLEPKKFDPGLKKIKTSLHQPQ